MLQVDNLTLRFGGLEALAAVDLAAADGEVLGLIGPNGSGKTSLFNVITGVYPPTTGRIRVAGSEVTGWPVHAIARHGVARTFQNLRLFERASVVDNVRAAQHTLGGAGSRAAAAERLLAAVDLLDRRDRLTGELTLAEQRRLELARALAREPRLLLLDEPAGGMTPNETATMAEILRSAAFPGRTCVVIEHKMDLIAALCDRLVVLDFGHKIADGPPAAVLAEPAVRRAYLGDEGGRRARGR